VSNKQEGSSCKQGGVRDVNCGDVCSPGAYAGEWLATKESSDRESNWAGGGYSLKEKGGAVRKGRGRGCAVGAGGHEPSKKSYNGIGHTVAKPAPRKTRAVRPTTKLVQLQKVEEVVSSAQKSRKKIWS